MFGLGTQSEIGDFSSPKKRVAPRGRRYSDWVIYKLQVEVGGGGNVDQRDLVLSKGDLV